MEKLLIKQLSKSNEPIGLISCLPQKINVFRAQDPQDLAPYKRALTFTPGPERFALEHGNKKLDVNDIIYIGTSESEVLTQENIERFQALLKNNSIPSVVFEQLSLKEAAKKEVKDFTACEIRRLAFLELFVLHSKICVLINPFEPVASNLREAIAEFLSEIAQTQEHIIIVPELNFRPNSWIESNSIQRIEVGQNLQKTIGLGNASSELQAMLEEVRQSAKSATQTATKPMQNSMLDEPTIALTNEIENNQKSGSKKYIAFAALVLVAIATFFSQDPLSLFNANKIVEVLPANHSGTQLAAVTNLDQKIETSVIITKPEIPVEKKQEPVEVKPTGVLDLYPKEVKASLLATYAGSSQSVDYQNRKAKTITPPQVSNTANTSAGENLFEALKRTTGTGGKIKGGEAGFARSESYDPSGIPLSEGSDEERREILREKFRAALERAAQR